MFTYKAARYGAPIEDEFATLDEAIKCARSDNERDEAWAIAITDDSGKTVIDEAQMDELLDRYL